MNQAEQTLISFLLPEGLLDYFEILKVDKESKELQIYLEVKNIAPSGYQISELESKGFLLEVGIQDFPIREQKVALRIKRRRWIVKKTDDIISRDCDLVRKGGSNDYGIRSFLI